jgi:Anticodon binding domain
MAFYSLFVAVLIYRQYEYAEEVKNILWDVGLDADVDNGTDTLNKKIRNGELAQYNFIFGTLPPFLTSSDFHSHNTYSRR